MERLLPLGILCAALLAACGPGERPAPADRPAPPTRSPISPNPGSSETGATAAPASRSPVPGDAEALVDAAISDAASRIGVPRDQIRVVRVEPRDWPDSGLGCPRPGLGYAQVITPGYLIVLEGGGRMLEYHTDRRRVELCRS